MLLSYFRNRRRKHWLSEPRPSEWQPWLRNHVWQFRHLQEELQQRALDFVCILFHEKKWVGGGDFEITDKMRVTVAGQAAMMTFGFEKPYYFDRLQSIIIYPGAYQGRPESTEDLLLGSYNDSTFGFDVRAGEAWQGGPIVLSWAAVEAEGRNVRRGRNVVVHEFAHHMDGLDGQTNGAPPMTDYEFEKRWYKVTGKEYQELLSLAQQGASTLIDRYGAENHAEFFAVATECFFTRPYRLKLEHAELYSVLVRLFGQDPREWLGADADDCPVLA